MTLYLPAVAGVLVAAASLAVAGLDERVVDVLGPAVLAYLAWMYSPLPDVPPEGSDGS